MPQLPSLTPRVPHTHWVTVKHADGTITQAEAEAYASRIRPQWEARMKVRVTVS